MQDLKRVSSFCAKFNSLLTVPVRQNLDSHVREGHAHLWVRTKFPNRLRLRSHARNAGMLVENFTDHKCWQTLQYFRVHAVISKSQDKCTLSEDTPACEWERNLKESDTNPTLLGLTVELRTDEVAHVAAMTAFPTRKKFVGWTGNRSPGARFLLKNGPCLRMSNKLAMFFRLLFASPVVELYILYIKGIDK